MSLGPGARLGSYEIVSLLGAGGMGEVYRARDPKLQRDVAIKALPFEFLADADRIARFEREAQALAALSHPAIGGIHELLEHEAQRYLVLEFVDGETLAARIARGALPLEEATPIAIQIADALEAAHDKGIIHRDLKPANIMITSEGRVKLLDFGLAKALGPATAASPALSQSPTMISMTAGVIIGTAAYMSPEQARGKAVDRRADIWAFGCVLYEMLTGKQAFGGETVSDTIGAVMRAEPEWSLLPSDTPPGVHRLLRRCLVKDARQRLPHIGVARMELAESGEAPPVPSARSSRRLLIWLTAALGVSVVLVSVLVAAILLLPREPASIGPVRFEINPPPGTARFGHVSGQRGPGVPAPHFAVSPDGRFLAFSAVGMDDHVDLWLRSLASTEARKLPATDDASFPFWSPDSREIGFFARDTLKTIAIDAESALSVCPVAAGEGGTWGSDGTMLFAMGGSIWRVPARGGPPVQVTEPEEGIAHSWPSMLPDAKTFVYLASARTQPGAPAARLRSLATGDDVEIVKTPTRVVYAARHLVFHRDGQLFAQPFDVSSQTTTGEARVIATQLATNNAGGRAAFQVSDAGVLVYRTGDASLFNRLQWWSRTGTESQTFADGHQFARINFSPDGSRLVAQVIDLAADAGTSRSDLWMFDLDRKVPTRFTTEAEFEAGAAWSPDGRFVAYATLPSRGAPPSELWMKAAGGAEAPRPVAKFSGVPSGWTPDGRALVVTRRDAKTGDDIWLVPIDGSEPRALIATPFDEREATYSPDGRWLVYLSSESGQLDVYVEPVPATGDKARVSPAGGINPEWSSDSKELFFASVGSIYSTAISRTGSGVTITTPQLIVRNAVDTNPTRGNADKFAVSLDRQRFLAITGTLSQTPPFTVVLNWPELVRDRTKR